MRQLAALTTCPLLLPDGRVIETPGFDDDSGILFDPQGVVFPPVPARPTREMAVIALDVLKWPFADFPFVDQAAWSVLWSALLSSTARMALPFVPCHAFDAPAAGTGKSKLVNCCSILVTGRECAAISQALDETEFEKKLAAVLLAGDPLVSIDNCTRAIDDPLLCMVLSEPEVQIRILGLSKTAIIPNRALLFANGNNFAFAGDMLRRGLVGRLDAKVERPELREFETEDPIVILKRERPRLVVAALTLLRAYIIAGQPDPQPPLGGFEDWSRLVRDALVWLGEEDPVLTIEDARDADPERQALVAVLTHWDVILGSRRVSAKDATDEASRFSMTPTATNPNHITYNYPDFRAALMAIAGDRGRVDSLRLGKWLGANKNKVVSDARIVADGILAGIAQWRMQHRQTDGSWL